MGAHLNIGDLFERLDNRKIIIRFCFEYESAWIINYRKDSAIRRGFFPQK